MTLSGGGGGNAELVTERECRLQCKTLSTEDYVDLLVTTFAEFPGVSNNNCNRLFLVFTCNRLSI